MTQPQPNPTGFTDLRTDALAAAVVSEYHDVLAPILRSASPQDWQGFTDVKQSEVRTIRRGVLPAAEGTGLDVHLKLFRAVRLSDRARDALAGARSLREFHNLREAQDRGLPCVRPAAAGACRGSFGSRSFLLTVTEPGAPLPRGPLPRTTAMQAGRLLRLAHDRGLHARDLHPGNILQRPDGELLLLDLTSAVLADPLDRQQRARALAWFCQDLDGLVRDPAARPLLVAYGADENVLALALRIGRRLRNRGLSAFGRRAFRPCRHTAVERPPRQPRWYLHRPQQQAWDAARDLWSKLASLEAHKSGRRGAVYLANRLVAKRRNSGAARSLFESAYLLLFAGVPTPAPVALTTHAGAGVVLSQRLPWPTVAEELQGNGIPDQDLVVAARRFGESVGRLHSFGLRNRDLKFENLARDPADNRVFMLDLDGVRRKAPLDERGRAADLGRLLSAFEHAGRPGGDRVSRSFLRGYSATCKWLQNRIRLRYLARLTAARASQWAAAHPSIHG